MLDARYRQIEFLPSLHGIYGALTPFLSQFQNKVLKGTDLTIGADTSNSHSKREKNFFMVFVKRIMAGESQ